MALPVACGRRTISRTICALGRQHRDWSADSQLFSRSKWEETALFRPVIEHYLSRYRRGPIPLAHRPRQRTQRPALAAGRGNRTASPAHHRPDALPSLPPGPRYSREPACYLSTDTASPLAVLDQAAFDRWQIEVNHREEKDILGVGDAPVRSPRSVERHPAFQIAIYSLIHLAGLLEYGPGRTDAYVPLAQVATQGPPPLASRPALAAAQGNP